jgi:hypothetical protein
LDVLVQHQGVENTGKTTACWSQLDMKQPAALWFAFVAQLHLIS